MTGFLLIFTFTKYNTGQYYSHKVSLQIYSIEILYNKLFD